MTETNEILASGAYGGSIRGPFPNNNVIGPVVDPPEMKMPPFLQTALGFTRIAYWNDLTIVSDVGLANSTVEGKSMWAAVARFDISSSGRFAARFSPVVLIFRSSDVVC